MEETKDVIFEIIPEFSGAPIKHFEIFDGKSKMWGKIKAILLEIANSKTITGTNLITWISKITTREQKQLIGLKEFLETSLAKDNLNYVPAIAQLALKIDTYFLNGKVRILQTDQVCRISRKVAASLIANSFFCTFPSKQPVKDLPTPHDFMYLFTHDSSLTKEKLSFFFMYLKQVAIKEPEGIIEISRTSSGDFTPEKISNEPLQEVKEGKDIGVESIPGVSMVDFADKLIGGLCLHSGAAQEEILFFNFPELLVARIINPMLSEQEAILIKGIQRFFTHKGYGRETKFEGIFEDSCIDREVIMIDAIDFRKVKSPLAQYEKPMIDREIIKAVAGFQGTKVIATGRWGCGVFRGNSQLKFLIQWIAASFCGRKMVFLGFGDKMLDNLNAIIKKYEGNPASELYSKMLEICKADAKIYETEKGFIFDKLLTI